MTRKLFTFRVFAVMLAFTGSVGPVLAQTTEIPAQVTRVQGVGVYLDSGTESGLGTMDTLDVRLATGMITRMQVLGASTGSSLLRWLEETIEVAVGDSLWLRVSVADSDVAGRTGNEAERESILGERGPPTISVVRARTGPRFRGSVALGFTGTRSITPSSARHDRRLLSYAIPSLTVRTVASGLPGGTRVTLNLRSDYRYSSSDLFSRRTSVRLYEFSIERELRSVNLELQAGRFLNRFEPSAGYWDGLLLSRRLGRIELGAAIGFEPDRYDEGFSSTLPKYSAHIRAQPLLGTVRWQTTASITQMQPANDWLSHTYVNLEQDLQFRSLSIRQDAQIDRNPEFGNWVVSRLRFRTGFRPSVPWSFFANYSIRQPYSYWRTKGPFSSRRDQASIGADYRGAGYGVGLSAISNAFESARRSYTYSLHFLLDRIPYAGVSFSLSGSYWAWGASATRYATAAFSRQLGPARLRLLYSLYSVDLHREVLTTHTAGVSAQIPFSRRLRLSADWRTTLNRDYTNNNLYLSLRVAF